ncbi:MAG: hypothetical protein HY711_10885 [Candidatus Melainabacteria bacterium]|nr:hypothetical protein [Candidatus Melainabacteria bacterium]
MTDNTSKWQQSDEVKQTIGQFGTGFSETAANIWTKEGFSLPKKNFSGEIISLNADKELNFGDIFRNIADEATHKLIELTIGASKVAIDSTDLSRRDKETLKRSLDNVGLLCHALGSVHEIVPKIDPQRKSLAIAFVRDKSHSVRRDGHTLTVGKEVTFNVSLDSKGQPSYNGLKGLSVDGHNLKDLELIVKKDKRGHEHLFLQTTAAKSHSKPKKILFPLN